MAPKKGEHCLSGLKATLTKNIAGGTFVWSMTRKQVTRFAIEQEVFNGANQFLLKNLLKFVRFINNCTICCNRERFLACHDFPLRDLV